MIDVFSETVEITDAERTGIARAAQAALDAEGRDGDLTILIDTPERIQTLNRKFRHVDPDRHAGTHSDAEPQVPARRRGDRRSDLSRVGGG